MKRMAAALVCVTSIISGCVSGAALSVAPSTNPASDLSPVSRSSPDAAASAALDLCSITDTKGAFGANGALGNDIVVGMGLVPHARDAAKYVRLVGVEPEIQTDDPAWLITTKGSIQLPLGPKMWDPTCVVVHGEANWFSTGDYQADDGSLVTPMPLKNQPPLGLPALAP